MDECTIYSNPSSACLITYYGSLGVFAVYGLFMVTFDLGQQVRLSCILFLIRVGVVGSVVNCVPPFRNAVPVPPGYLDPQWRLWT